MAAPMKLSRFCNSSYSRFLSNPKVFLRSKIIHKSFCSAPADSPNDGQCKDVAHLFIQKEVQQLLKQLAGKDLNKVYRTKKLKQLNNPSYYFMTDAELQNIQKEMEDKADESLAMPPVLNPRKPIKEILSDDKALKGLLNTNYVFTDITYGLSLKERTVVVRQPDGILRTATWDEKIRMNNIYFPQEHAEIFVPKMFHPEHIKVPLNLGHHLFILDRACLQFEPDDPDFIRVCHTTYEHINTHRKYDVLHSTRHYGPMMFYFTLHKKIDDILLHYIQNERFDDATHLVKLYKVLHPESKFECNENQSNIEFVETFVKSEAIKKANLELAIQTYKEIIHHRNIVSEEQAKAHGSIS